MPTPRDEAVAKHNEMLSFLADQIEKIIEGEIEQGNLRIVLGTDQLPPGTNMAALKLVAQRYRDVGWDAHAENDQRDGMFIEVQG